ncbi:MAG TPA: spore coat protein U domain-containing protein [Limnobacter sp.]|nr:spore coat protein U domain-containing protein [Limnobacter sp.]
MNKPFLLKRSLPLALAVMSAPAHALFNPSCSVGAGSSPAPQVYNASNPAAHTASFNLVVSCISLLGTGATNVSVALNGGASGNPAARHMVGPGGTTLSYNIFSGGAIVSSGGGGLLTVTLNLLSLVVPVVHNFPLTLVIPAGQYRSIGAYSDTITVTVTYN